MMLNHLLLTRYSSNGIFINNYTICSRGPGLLVVRSAGRVPLGPPPLYDDPIWSCDSTVISLRCLFTL